MFASFQSQRPSSSSHDATVAEWHDKFTTREAFFQRQFVGQCRQTVQTRSFHQRGRDFKVGVKARRDKHCSLRSICRCIGRHCCACLSKNVGGAGSSLVERKHKRVHNRMTGLVDAVAGDPRTDRHLDTDIDVRVTSQSNFEIPTSASGRTVKSLEMHRIPACPEGV